MGGYRLHISFRKLVTLASPPYGIRTFCYPAPTASLFGSVTWADAGGMAAARIHTHETIKLTVKRLVLSCPDPAECAFPSASVLIEPRHLRQDNSRPSDIFVMGNGMHRKDYVMDVVVTSTM